MTNESPSSTTPDLGQKALASSYSTSKTRKALHPTARSPQKPSCEAVAEAPSSSELAKASGNVGLGSTPAVPNLNGLERGLQIC